MNNPTIECPNCGTEIPVTEALARPMLEAERSRLETEARQRSSALETRAKDLQNQQQSLELRKQDVLSKETDIDRIIQERMGTERQQIAAAEARRIEGHFQEQLDAAHNQQRAQSAKIGELQRSEIDFRKKTIALEEQTRQMELDIARQVDAERDRIREQAVSDEQKRVESHLAQREAHFHQQLDAANNQQRAQSLKITQLQQAEIDFRKKSIALEEQTRQMELDIARQVDAERDRIREQAVNEEQKRSESMLNAKEKSFAILGEQLREAQGKELALRKDREALENEKRSNDLHVQRRIDEERQAVRAATQKEECDRHHLKVAEKDKLIADMNKQIADLQHKGQQTSSWLKGETQELELESILRIQFPKDHFEAIAAGRPGGDLIQIVFGPNGLSCGSILWESKRTKSWQDGWLQKIRDDQRSAHTTVCVIVSAALPKGLDSFDRIDDVWVASFDLAVPLAKALHQTLTQNAFYQNASQDRNTKADRIYNYVTGQDLNQRVSAIVEGYKGLRSNLEKEKQATTAAWAKREKFHEMLLSGTAGLYGDMLSIAGSSMPEIEDFEGQRNLPCRYEDLIKHLPESQSAHG